MRTTLRHLLLPAVLLLGAVACDGTEEVPSVETDAASEDKGPPERVLEDVAYRFCHEDGVDATDAREFCTLLDGQPDDWCPGLRASCEGAETASEPAGCNESSGGPGRLFAPPPERRNPVESCDPDFSGCTPPASPVEWLQALLKWGTAFLVALGGVFLLVLILRFIGTRRGEEVVEVARGVVRDDAPLDVLDEEVPDLPGATLLQQAQEALESERFVEAVALARAAALRGLAEEGAIRLHRARTDREYVRQTRRKKPDAEASLAEVVRAVEGQRFGGRLIDAQTAERVLAAVGRLLRNIAPFLLIAVMLGAGDDYRFGPQGDSGLFDLLVDHDYDVTWRLRGLDSVDEETDVLVLDLSGVTPSEEDWSALRTWVSAGGVLVLGGVPEAAFPEVGVVVNMPINGAAEVVPGLAPYLPTPRFPADEEGFLEPGGVWPWVTVDDLGEPRIVVGSVFVEEGALVVFTDARMLWNGALVWPNNEDFLGDMLTVAMSEGYLPYREEIHVQLATLASSGSDSPASSLMQANLLPFVLQLLLLVGVGALWKGWPFRPLRDPPQEGRARYSEHARALGSQYEKLGATHFVLSRAAALWLHRRGRTGLLVAAERHGHTPSSAATLVDALQAAADSPSADDQSDDLELLEELCRITEHP